MCRKILTQLNQLIITKFHPILIYHLPQEPAIHRQGLEITLLLNYHTALFVLCVDRIKKLELLHVNLWKVLNEVVDWDVWVEVLAVGWEEIGLDVIVEFLCLYDWDCFKVGLLEFLWWVIDMVRICSWGVVHGSASSFLQIVNRSL